MRSVTLGYPLFSACFWGSRATSRKHSHAARLRLRLEPSIYALLSTARHPEVAERGHASRHDLCESDARPNVLGTLQRAASHMPLSPVRRPQPRPSQAPHAATNARHLRSSAAAAAVDAATRSHLAHKARMGSSGETRRVHAPGAESEPRPPIPTSFKRCSGGRTAPAEARWSSRRAAAARLNIALSPGRRQATISGPPEAGYSTVTPQKHEARKANKADGRRRPKVREGGTWQRCGRPVSKPAPATPSRSVGTRPPLRWKRMNRQAGHACELWSGPPGRRPPNPCTHTRMREGACARRRVHPWIWYRAGEGKDNTHPCKQACPRKCSNITPLKL